MLITVYFTACTSKVTKYKIVSTNKLTNYLISNCLLLQQSQQLIEACEKGSLSEVISLIERGASVHSTDEVSDCIRII